jgi:hypothetical protein
VASVPDDVLRPLDSLLSKSRKARERLPAGSWQHAMLTANLAALETGRTLLVAPPREGSRFSRKDLDAARETLAALIERVTAARESFRAGTSHHTLQGNRLRALQHAQAAVDAALSDR